MKLIFGLLTCVLIIVHAVLAQSEAAFTAHNGTISPFPLADDLLTFNIGIFDPVCGLTYEVNISVQNRGDASKTSDNCNLLYDYITNTTSNGESSKDVNVVYTCPGTPEPTDPEGYGSLDIKFILNCPSDFAEDQTQEPATLQLLNIHDATDLTVPVSIGYEVYSNSAIIWQFINCP
ncbi:uncharacterized protein Z520_04011 [Fonsecaea multimorphosa CBS 102226]|uniref:Phosphatidylglycerol/phosphatidylinositol transfer protein n=1 Tax=Fonsecaea multimorphosa CBS 102226 TaxID=1442371 RepID=A0A0D2HEK6_9EURO|nr:uncharacterized protein Z520_04011 [Fonsecaea multimorphosa CBS 102226]KIY00326.1 hypothetical protein Z520_04011 [Fonsecaea multimorphosa CBS 102226]OAL27158.1 hypothetical protein AYO22_03789 [Fonsecaea multimorphosa]